AVRHGAARGGGHDRPEPRSLQGRGPGPGGEGPGAHVPGDPRGRRGSAVGGYRPMKMLKAIVRPERENDVVKALEAAGIVAMTRMDVLGRGQQGGVQVGATLYDEIPKVQFLVAVEDAQVEVALKAIQEG